MTDFVGNPLQYIIFRGCCGVVVRIYAVGECEMGPALLPTPLSPACGLRDESQCLTPGVSLLSAGRSPRHIRYVARRSRRCRIASPDRSISRGSVHAVAALSEARPVPSPQAVPGFLWGETGSIGVGPVARPVRAMFALRIQQSAGGIPWGRPVGFPPSPDFTSSRRSGFPSSKVRIGRRSFPSIRCS